jgi:intracellular septation protein
MKFILSFFPIVLFFLVYKIKELHFYEGEGLYSAIIAMTVATLIQIFISRFIDKKFEKSQVIGLLLLIIFGGVTIYVDNPAFIMWKVSVLYVLFALILIGSIWIGKKNLFSLILGKELKLPDKSWNQLIWIWGLGFIFIAIINAYYYVLPSIKANNDFFGDQDRFNLSGFDCSTSVKENLCLIAQQTEESWVNFKLFGTMGLTFILIIITIFFTYKHLKEHEVTK